MRFFQNYSLLKWNTFGLDVKTKFFYDFDSVDELKQQIAEKFIQGNTWLVIGQGSNLLFLDDYPGTVLHCAFQNIAVEEKDDHVLLEVGAGVIWDELVAFCVAKGWSGIENLSLIPGETGAAAIQNIGAYGVEFQDVVQQVNAVAIADGTERNFDVSDCQYAYRASVFKKELKNQYIITSVVIKLAKESSFHLEYQNLHEEVCKRGEITLANIRKTIIAIRESKLPDTRKTGNAGSFFMNPLIQKRHFEKLQLAFPGIPYYALSDNLIKIPAAWMIEQCGWKGKSRGRAAVHNKQALVLINLGGATGREIADLAATIQQTVYNTFKIQLVPEVLYV